MNKQQLKKHHAMNSPNIEGEASSKVQYISVNKNFINKKPTNKINEYEN